MPSRCLSNVPPPSSATPSPYCRAWYFVACAQSTPAVLAVSPPCVSPALRLCAGWAAWGTEKASMAGRHCLATAGAGVGNQRWFSHKSKSQPHVGCYEESERHPIQTPHNNLESDFKEIQCLFWMCNLLCKCTVLPLWFQCSWALVTLSEFLEEGSRCMQDMQGSTAASQHSKAKPSKTAFFQKLLSSVFLSLRVTRGNTFLGYRWPLN